MSYTDDTYSYYKSYYISKAWLELALTEINNTDVWFSHTIPEDSIINTNNFSCIWCHFESQVLWRYPIVSNNFWQTTWCDEDNVLSLWKAESITLPLFYDNSLSSDQVFDNSNHIVNVSSALSNLRLIFPAWINYLWSQLKLWVVYETWWITNRTYLFMRWISMNLADNFFTKYVQEYNSEYDPSVWEKNWLPYLVISNPNPFEVKFCIWNKDWSSQDIPTTKYFISSRGEYNWRTIWLQAVYAQPIPSFFISPYSN